MTSVPSAPFKIGDVVRHTADVDVPLVVVGLECTWFERAESYGWLITVHHWFHGSTVCEAAELVEASVVSHREADALRRTFPAARLPLVAM